VNAGKVTKVYKLDYRDGFEWLQPVVSQDYRKLRFDGTPRITSWEPVEMERVTEDDNGTRRQPGDFPACSGGDMLFVSARAKTLLDQVLREAGELLPLACSDGEFWALNVILQLDALDEGLADVLRASDTGRILRIRRHAFRSERLGAEIFKLSQTPRGLIYVTETFVNRVKATTLEGLGFKLVWAAN
jgi:hypothetical protein